MYESRFDPQNVVENCVDLIRKTTNAPLSDCHKSLLGIMSILEPHLGSTSDIFAAINQKSLDYNVNIDSCYDRRCVNEVCERLYDQFMEKQELSCVANQNDEEMIENLNLFSDFSQKTDPRIPFVVISSDDFHWMKQLLIVLELDQSTEVQKAFINTLHILISRCDESMKNFLIETQLTKILVSLTFKSSTDENELKKRALHVLSLLFDIDILPPLNQLDLLNADYFGSLYRSISKIDGSDVFDLCVNFYYHVERHSVSSDALFYPMTSDPFSCSEFGIVCIEELNTLCTARRLKFIQQILRLNPETVHSIFYENDLKVLARVLVREMADHSSSQARDLCNSCIEIMHDSGIVRKEDLSF